MHTGDCGTAQSSANDAKDLARGLSQRLVGPSGQGTPTSCVEPFVIAHWVSYVHSILMQNLLAFGALVCLGVGVSCSIHVVNIDMKVIIAPHEG